MHGYITNNTRHAHQKNNIRYSHIFTRFLCYKSTYCIIKKQKENFYEMKFQKYQVSLRFSFKKRPNFVQPLFVNFAHSYCHGHILYFLYIKQELHKQPLYKKISRLNISEYLIIVRLSSQRNCEYPLYCHWQRVNIISPRENTAINRGERGGGYKPVRNIPQVKWVQ